MHSYFLKMSKEVNSNYFKFQVMDRAREVPFATGPTGSLGFRQDYNKQISYSQILKAQTVNLPAFPGVIKTKIQQLTNSEVIDSHLFK